MYQISQEDLDAIGKGLEDYYQIALDEGIRSIFDNMARSRMGVVAAKIDQSKDAIASLRKPSVDSLSVTLKPLLATQLNRYLANRNDVAKDLVDISILALNTLASNIPVPGLGSVISMAINAGGSAAQKELHQRAVNDADAVLTGQSGGSVKKLFINDAEAQASAIKSMEQYKLICRFIKTMPERITTFDEAVTIPASTFKVQKATSALTIELWALKQYLEAMESRLVEITALPDFPW